MRTIFSVIVLLTICSGWASAQLEKKYSGQGYVFFAPGVVAPGGSGTFQVGGGGEGFVHKGLGVGAEIGYLFPRTSAGDGLGLFSVNGSYNFQNPQSGRKLIPFVTGGYSLAFRGGSANLLNFGGGVNYWFREKMGLRLEFRDHLGSPCGCRVQFLQFRIGLAFR
jgi:hypothetical protein